MMLRLPKLRMNSSLCLLQRVAIKSLSSSCQPSASHSVICCTIKTSPSHRTSVARYLANAQTSSCIHGSFSHKMQHKQFSAGISSCTYGGSHYLVGHRQIGSIVPLSSQKGLFLHVRSRHPGLFISARGQSTNSKDHSTTVLYITAIGIFMVGFAYAGVPLYRMFCQATGAGGQAVFGDDSRVEQMTPVKQRRLQIRFNADTTSSMQWSFRPQQAQIEVVPGETALAFYTAKNPTDKAIIGISTYNVVPFEAGQYFNKIQCFCFEEQRLNAHEEVDMPVFFYIDPDIMNDPKLENVSIITLSYTFFEAKEGMSLPLPGYMQSRQPV